ncbi:hypothetical protein [Candidatus Methylacidithermus pantelleriae]|uniref:hypothetical protein n=1 Tax=Candidatus Methylacidithermus pantelleriae TaxID=2744239 RepID=UPI00157DB644|nr:hypothetical protein [Candidatus Methylacidithermus pantelleriae]
MRLESRIGYKDLVWKDLPGRVGRSAWARSQGQVRLATNLAGGRTKGALIVRWTFRGRACWYA